MIPQQASHIVQIGFKAFFDIDPIVTEHLINKVVNHGVVAAYSACHVLRAIDVKCGEVLSPIMNDLRINMQSA